MRAAIFLVLAACGGAVQTSEAGALEAGVDAFELEAAIDAPAEAAKDAGAACPVLGVPCDYMTAQTWCTDDRTAKWVCFTGMWERQPCMPGFCGADEGGYVCTGPVCK